MAAPREIRNKIRSVKSTQKITRAMELVAASKMRRAQERMAKSRPYAEKMRQVIGHVAKSHSEYHHPYLTPRPEVKRVGLIIISTDRGLCGPLNTNLFRNAIKAMKEWADKSIEIDLCTIGHKGEVFFSRFGGNILAQKSHLGDKPTVNDFIGVVKVMLEAYDKGKIDALYMASNEFVNTMTQRSRIQPLLPLEIVEPEAKEGAQKGYWDYIYEPFAKDLLDVLLVRYIESQVYQGVVENFACAMAAQMVAMKSATENAGEIIKELQLIYNKVRQAAITREIAEIVGGAEAL